MRVEKMWQRINPYINAPVIMMTLYFMYQQIYDPHCMVMMGCLQRVIIPALRARGRYVYVVVGRRTGIVGEKDLGGGMVCQSMILLRATH